MELLEWEESKIVECKQSKYTVENMLKFVEKILDDTDNVNIRMNDNNTNELVCSKPINYFIVLDLLTKQRVRTLQSQ